MSDYYAFLSSLINLVSDPLRSLDARVGIPVVTALLLGLIGSTSPCQLTTNVAALAFVSREAASSRRVVASALAYLLGKVAVYSVLGMLIVVAGLELSRTAIPVVVVMRKALGPLLILIGLLMLGVLRLDLSVGQRLSSRLEESARRGGPLGPFLLGVAFAFAFCPTLFWLFFGLLVPLSISSRDGLLYPGLFALGTSLPLLAFAGLLALGARNVSRYVHQVKRLDRLARRAAGVVFIIGGANETILYWLW